jgi:hypothetical protein
VRHLHNSEPANISVLVLVAGFSAVFAIAYLISFVLSFHFSMGV